MAEQRDFEEAPRSDRKRVDWETLRRERKRVDWQEALHRIERPSHDDGRWSFAEAMKRGARVQAVGPVQPIDPGRASAYATAAFRDEIATLQRTPEGERNDQLNRSGFSLAQLVAAGHLDGQTVYDALAQTSRAIGLTEREIAATLRSSFGAGAALPRAVPERRARSVSGPSNPEGDNRDVSREEFEAETPIPVTFGAMLPAFPTDALPDTYRAMVEATAEATQTDPAMAGTTCLAVLAAAAGGRAELEVRKGWREQLVLYTVVVAQPGERKSGVQRAMLQPFADAEKTLADRAEPDRIAKMADKEIAQRQADAAKKKAAASGAADAIAEAHSAALAAEQISVPAIPQLVADDVTPEATASLLAEQHGRLAVMSAEGGIFNTLAGRYANNVPQLDVFLKGHAGDMLRVNRKGRAPEFIAHPALTLALMVQPDVLASIGRNQTFRGRGLLARFLYAYPPSKLGSRNVGAAPVPDDVQAKYESAVTSLVTTLADRTEPAVLLLDSDAANDVVTLERLVEPTLGPGGELADLSGWGAKFVGVILRIAALLHLAEYGAHAGTDESITFDALWRATRLGNYYKQHAIRAFAEMRVDEDAEAARYLLERIGSQDQTELSRRDLHRLAQVFRSAEEVATPLHRLVTHGWLLPVEQPPNPSGRPSSPRYSVHPKVWE